jgi:hypothetical protein
VRRKLRRFQEKLRRFDKKLRRNEKTAPILRERANFCADLNRKHKNSFRKKTFRFSCGDGTVALVFCFGSENQARQAIYCSFSQ